MDIEKLREGIARYFYSATNMGINFKATDRKGISLEFADKYIIPLLQELKLGTGVPLKVPEEPQWYDDAIGIAGKQGWTLAIQKFLEENKEGFEPLGDEK